MPGATTTKKLQNYAALAEYFRGVTDEEIAQLTERFMGITTLGSRSKLS